MRKLKESSSQTAGPYVHIGCVPQTAGLEQRGMGPQLGVKMVGAEAAQKAITLDICIFDGNGQLVKDALVEIWQADPNGTFGQARGFSSWGRQATDLETGHATFETVKPGAVGGASTACAGLDSSAWDQPCAHDAHLFSR